MDQQCKDMIIKNFVSLMKYCNVELLKKPLINKGIFSNNEMSNIFSTNDARHNKRVFFFNIQKKNNAWISLLEALRESHQDNIVDLLTRRKGGAVPFSQMTPPSEEEIKHIENLDKLPAILSTTLNVAVKPSSVFYDVPEHNGHLHFYKSRSKMRGRLLLINNYDFWNPDKHAYRNGASMDNTNLKELFEQMGGWNLDDFHINKTTAQMDTLITNFANYEDNHLYDICFLILMSHGNSINNDTIIFGIDGYHITSSSIEEKFSNEKCTSWISKPKVMLFQACRGDESMIPIIHQRTETDSMTKNSTANISHVSIRPQEDLLVGNSTLLGYKTHRDFNRGSWYVELLCRTFMNHAHDHAVNDLLDMIDQQLRRRMSEMHTMQTAEYRNVGFNKLYLHPGIYFEDGMIKKY